MGFLADWLAARLTAWQRERLGGDVATTAPHPPQRPVAAVPDAPAPTAAKIAARYVDCACQLLLRGRDDAAVACLLDALRWNEAAALLAVEQSADTATRACAGLCADILSQQRNGATVAWGTPPPAPVRKISVVICSIDDVRFAAARDTYTAALAGGPFEIIRIDDARSLAEGYNRGIEQGTGEIVVFSHDDVQILAPAFREELTAALDRYDLVGVAGSTRLAGPQWTSGDAAERRQLVCYPAGATGDECSCALDGPSYEERNYGDIQALDGLFLAARRERLAELRFDAERYDGFHLYDLDFSYRAWQAGWRLAVCPRLGLMHFSGGRFDDVWRRYAEVFCEQHGLSFAGGAPLSSAPAFADAAALQAFLAARFTWQDTRRAQGHTLPDTPAEPAGHQKTLLHVGCGSHRREHTGPGFQSDEWREIRLDADASAAPDLLGTATDLSAVPSASVDAVFSSHTLEHLYWHEVPQGLAEMRRVLRDDGVVVAWVPDLQAAARMIAEDKPFAIIGQTPFGPLTPFDMVFSHRGAVGRDRPFMAHYCGFTASTLAAVHREAGFGTVVVRPRIAGFDLQLLATPPALPPGLVQALAAVHFQD